MVILPSRRLVVFAAILAAGCTEEPARRQTRSGLDVGKKAPEILGRDLAGKEVRLSDYRGKVVLIDFWRPACPPCALLHKQEVYFSRTYAKRGLAIVGVFLSDALEAGRKVEEREEISWPSIADTSGAISYQWGVRGTPTVFLLDGEGVIRYLSNGYPPEGELETKIIQMLDEKPT